MKTSHELAQALLALPDRPLVQYWEYDGMEGYNTNFELSHETLFAKMRNGQFQDHVRTWEKDEEFLPLPVIRIVATD